MVLGANLMRMLAAMAMLAVLSLTPSASWAHAGHSHGSQVTASQSVQQPAAPSEAARADQVQELSSTIPAAPEQHDGCAHRGCCSSGPCTGFHGFVLTPESLLAPPSLSSALIGGDLPSGSAAAASRLRRPPKSLA